MPTTSPELLIAVAAPDVSPADSGSSETRSLCCVSQTTGRNCNCCGGTQVASRQAFSAQPTASPLLFAAVAYPLLPPSVGSPRITPFSHAKPSAMQPTPNGPPDNPPLLHT